MDIAKLQTQLCLLRVQSMTPLTWSETCNSPDRTDCDITSQILLRRTHTVTGTTMPDNVPDQNLPLREIIV